MTINNNKKYRDILLETVDKKYRKRMFVNKLVTISTVVFVIAPIIPKTSIFI